MASYLHLSTGSLEPYNGQSEDIRAQTGQNHDRSVLTDESIALQFLEFSPQSAAMEFNFSESASSDQSYSLASFDNPLAQMSHTFGAQPIFPQDYPLHTAQSFSGVSAPYSQSPTSPATSFNANMQPNFHQAGTLTAINHNQPSNHSPYGDPHLKYEQSSDEGLIAPSTFPGQIHQAPWSAESALRFNQQSISFQQPWTIPAPSLDAIASYPNSLQYDSSPHGEGLATPGSGQSPVMSSAHLHSSSASSTADQQQSRYFHPNTHISHYHPQAGFLDSQIPDFIPANHGLADPQALLIDPTTEQHDLCDHANSPTSDYVMVELDDIVSNDSRTATQSKVHRSTSRRSPASTKTKQEADIFVSEFHSSSGPIRRQSGGKGKRKADDSKRAGGRATGMHLNPDAAARAKALREEGSCWVCCFQRDSCSPGHICGRCIKRHERNQMEHGLGCDRTKLNDLRPYFIPDFLARSCDKKVLNQFMENHVRGWDRKPILIRVNVVWGQSPMTLEMYEFMPKSTDLVQHFQNVLNEQTGQRSWVQKASPPIALRCIDNENHQKYEKYIDGIVDSPRNLGEFVDRCFRYEKDDFQGRLFRLLYDYRPDQKEEKSLRREIMRLMIITYIYSRASTITNGDLPILSTLHYAAHNKIEYGKATTARLANRQLKYLYTSLWINIMENVLRKLQQVLRSSRGGPKWSAAFCAVLGLGMAFETIQITSHTHQEADTMLGNSTNWDARERAESACRLIDEKFYFLSTLFKWKYHRGFNPFRNITDSKVQESLGPQALALVRGVYELVQEKSDYLSYREQIAIHNDNKDRYTSRLVARFLLAFWKPVP